ncbi:MAG: ankyrin repeat domain-containing protein [Myxococcota bacterium]|nr:ankyrin repeat domain-containing protein [Myxococcota bacterium]
MTETEAQTVQKRLRDNDSLEIPEANSDVVRSYYFDPIESKYCCLTIDGVTPFADSVHIYDDFSDLYREVLSPYPLPFLLEAIRVTTERINRFYALCCAQTVDATAIEKMIAEPFNYEMLVWDRSRHVYGYMTPLQALVLRRPAATSSIDLLLKKGVNPNRKTGMQKRQSTAFFYACSYAHYNEVQRMLPHIDINFVLEHTSPMAVCKPTALMSCIQRFQENSPMEKERLGTYRLLLEHGANINYVHYNGESVVMNIIDIDKVEFLENIPAHVSLNLNYHAEVEEFFHNQYTPLGFCAQQMSIHNDKKQIFLKLLELGADINRKDGAGKTPLFYSVWNEQLEVYDQAEVNWAATNREGQTALIHYAHANKKRTEVPAYLLARSVDINATDHNGDTALHIALRNQDSILALFLMEQGCTFDIANHNQERPLDIANANNLSAVLSKMKQSRSVPEISVEDLCVQILEEGFTYAFGTKKIVHVQFDSRAWYRYANSAADHHIYRNYSCTREWIREYLCALILEEDNPEEQMYFLSFINRYLAKTKAPLWDMQELKSRFEQSYLSEQISLDISKEEVAQACMAYLKAGGSFSSSNKEGMESYQYRPSSHRFHYKAEGYNHSQDQSYTEEEFEEMCTRSITKMDDYPFRMDFRGFFFHQDLTDVLTFLGFETWRSWKRASQQNDAHTKT